MVVLSVNNRSCLEVLVFIIIAGSTGCAPKQGTLDGDVFIVTQGGESVKLGLVEVRVLPYQQTKNSIAETRTQFDHEIANLQPKLDAAREAFASAGTRLKVRQEQEGVAHKYWVENSLDSDGEKAEKIAAERERTAALTAAQAQAALAAVEAEARTWSSAALYFEKLPSPLASAKTDADGKFSIPLDRKATVALAAHATRHLVDKVEEYYWLVGVSLEGEPTKRIFLSNDNLVTVDSRESLLYAVE